MVCNNRLLKNWSPRVSVKTTSLARDLESGKGPNGRQQVKKSFTSGPRWKLLFVCVCVHWQCFAAAHLF